MISELKAISPLFTKPEKQKFSLLFFLMLIAALFEAFNVAAVGAFANFLSNPQAISESKLSLGLLPNLPEKPTLKLAIIASALLLGFTLLKNFFITVVYYIQSRMINNQSVRLRSRMFRCYQKAPYDWIMQRGLPEIQRNIQQDTAAVLQGVVMSSLDLVLALVMSISVITVMLISTPSSTLFSILFIATGTYLLIRFMRKHMQRIGETTRNEGRESFKAIQQGFGAFVDARIIGCEKALANTYRVSSKKIAKANALYSLLNKVTPNIIEAIAIGGMLLILMILISSGNSIEDSLPTLSILIVVIIRLKKIGSEIATKINRINNTKPAIPQLINDLKTLEGFEEAHEANAVKANQRIQHFDQVVLDNISYTYPKTERPAINNLSLSIQQGESIAFVGTTGCGKSTIVNLILGLLAPQKGEIRVGDCNIQHDLSNWRDYLGYIPQNIYLIDDSIRANIAFGVDPDKIDDAQVNKVLEDAALLKYVNELPDGVNTIIGESGVRLSGGQKQRLGIARALYFAPELLILDEATSALDNQTEVEVIEAIQRSKEGRTLIMIAHRLTTVIDCDTIYLMENGEIKDSGNYNELLDKSEKFQRMARVATND